jgi:hypothetical protein
MSDSSGRHLISKSASSLIYWKNIFVFHWKLMNEKKNDFLREKTTKNLINGRSVRQTTNQIWEMREEE